MAQIEPTGDEARAAGVGERQSARWSGIVLPKAPDPLLKLRLRAITPLFLGGAGHEAGEQYASLPGLIRWWLRALLGGVLAAGGQSNDIRRAAALEGDLMGATDWARPFQFRLKVQGGRREAGDLTARELDAYNDLGLYKECSYVAFPFLNTVPAWTRSWYRPGATLDLQIEGRGVAPDSSAALALAGTMWCWATLGGLGARSRRGFGALQLIDADGELARSFSEFCTSGRQPGVQAGGASVWLPPMDTDGWEGFLACGLNGAFRAVAEYADLPSAPPLVPDPPDGSPALPQSTTSPRPDWSSLAPGHWRLLLIPLAGHKTQTVQEQPDLVWSRTLGALGKLIRGFREDPTGKTLQTGGHTTFDYTGSATGGATPYGLESFFGGQPPTSLPVDLLNDEFGLPWNWFQIQSRKKAVVEPTPLDGADPPDDPPPGLGRRASPLLARPVVLERDPQQRITRCGLLFLALRARFLPSDVGLRLRDEPGRVTAYRVETPPDHLPQLVKFMEHVRTHVGGVLADLPGGRASGSADRQGGGGSKRP